MVTFFARKQGIESPAFLVIPFQLSPLVAG